MQCWICRNDMCRMLWCTRTSIIGMQKLLLCHELRSLYLRFRQIDSILPRLAVFSRGLAHMQWSNSHRNIHSSISGASGLWSSASKSCSFATNKWARSHILNEVLNITNRFSVPDGIAKCAVLKQSQRDSRHMLRILLCIRILSICQYMLRLCQEYTSRVLYTIWSIQYCWECLSTKWNSHRYCAETAITGIKTFVEDYLVHVNFDDMPGNATALLRIRNPVSGIVIQQLNIASPDIIAKWDWQIYRAGPVVTKLMTDPDDSQVYLTIAELDVVSVLTSKCIHGLRLLVHYKFGNDKWFEALWLHHAQHWTYDTYWEIDQLGMWNVAYQLTSSHFRHY